MHCPRFSCSALLVVGVVLAAWDGGAAAADLTVKQIYQRTLHATCWIHTKQTTGTGWLVDQRRSRVITNYHVVGDSDTVTVLFPAYADGKVIADRDHYAKKGRRLRGKVISKDPQRDLALIEVNALPDGAAELRLARDSVGPGDRVHTVGNPGASGALWVYTSGVIRTEVFRVRTKLGDVGKGEGTQTIDAQVFETQSPINPGDSGGPVVNDRGELVGVNSASGRGAQQVTLCIHVGEVKAFLEDGPAPVREPATAVNTTEVALKLREQGTSLLRQSQYQAAVDALTRSLNLNPRDHVAYNERGAAYTWLGKDAEAIGDFTRAIRLDKQFAVAYRNRGSAYLRQGQPQEAVDDLTQAIALNGDYARAYKVRGDAYTKLGKIREAQADYRKATELERAKK